MMIVRKIENLSIHSGHINNRFKVQAIVYCSGNVVEWTENDNVLTTLSSIIALRFSNQLFFILGSASFEISYLSLSLRHSVLKI
jgi:ABC-type uncharacterized transport system permease subunit